MQKAFCFLIVVFASLGAYAGKLDLTCQDPVAAYLRDGLERIRLVLYSSNAADSFFELKLATQPDDQYISGTIKITTRTRDKLAGDLIAGEKMGHFSLPVPPLWGPSKIQVHMNDVKLPDAVCDLTNN